MGLDKPADFFGFSSGFFAVWIIHLGRRYSLFDAVGSHPGSARELSDTLRLSEAPVELWCDAAATFGLLEKKGRSYSMPRRMRQMLVREQNVDFVGGHFSYLALRSLDFDKFDDLFGFKQEPRLPHKTEAFIEGTRWDHTAFFKIILHKLPQLRRSLERGADILDLGCGSGSWSLKVAERFPNSTIKGIDPDNEAIVMAHKTAVAAGLNDRVRFETARGEALDFDQLFQLVYVGEVLYLVADRLRFLRNCHRALEDGGWIVLVEGLTSKSMSALDARLLSTYRLDYAQQGGRLLDQSEVAKLLTKAGFSRPSFINVGGGLWFVVARKA